MLKRGQVTVFIILGIIIIAAAAFGIFLRKDIAKGVASLESKVTSSFEGDVEEVKAQVEGCLDSAMKEAVYNSAFGRMRDLTEEKYEAAVASFVKGRASECIDVSKFDRLTITKESPLEVTVDYKKTYITATANMRLKLVEGDQTGTLSEFKSKLDLKVPVYGVGASA